MRAVQSEGPKVRRSAGRSILGAVLLVALALFVPVRGDAPHVYAITGARIVTAAGAPIESGTLVIRNGLIDAVGPAAAAPADAMTIDGRGLTLYPGLIDLGYAGGLDVPASPPPQNPRTRLDGERWKRQWILHPYLEAANYVRSDAPDLRRLAAAGITT